MAQQIGWRGWLLVPEGEALRLASPSDPANIWQPGEEHVARCYETPGASFVFSQLEPDFSPVGAARSHYRQNAGTHDAPRGDCLCGIHAFADREPLEAWFGPEHRLIQVADACGVPNAGFVFGRVALSGRIVEDVELGLWGGGWRVERARLLALSTNNPAHALGLRDYGVPIEDSCGEAWPLELWSLMAEILDRSSGGQSPVHGLAHWLGVACAGRQFAAETPGADPVVVRLFALFHDALRENDHDDPEHGRRGAALARQLYADGNLVLTEPQLELLVRACDGHDAGTTTDDPTIGCCWDADRIELLRVGMCPRPEFFSTPTGRRWATSLSLVLAG